MRTMAEAFGVVVGTGHGQAARNARRIAAKAEKAAKDTLMEKWGDAPQTPLYALTVRRKEHGAYKKERHTVSSMDGVSTGRGKKR